MLKNPKTTNLRITSGEYKGRAIKAPATPVTHPMGSREKTALFNVLTGFFGPSLDETRVLDCYCGSGALGLEALSRGAMSAVFVDNNSAAVKITKENIASFGILSRASVIKSNVLKLSTSDFGLFNLIFTDPPYDNFPVTLENLIPLLSPSGVLVLSHPDSVDPASVIPDLKLFSTKSYASCNLAFFKR